MKQKVSQVIYMGFITILISMLIFLSFSMVSCKSLQQTKGYEQYESNTYWK